MSGRVKWDRYKKLPGIERADVEVLSYLDKDTPFSESIHVGRVVPVYALTEGLNLRFLRQLIYQCLNEYLDILVDPLPADIQRQNQLLDLKTALMDIHFPETIEKSKAARTRLVFDELFYLQARLAMIRQQFKQTTQGVAMTVKPEGYVGQFLENLPFELTNAQQRVFEEIKRDLTMTEPMYRLLQGDVGSGKTVIAILSILMAIDNGYQAALMVPTEILAEQHFKNCVNWLTPLGLRAGLFVGKSKVKERREMRQALLNGQIHIAVGTHALIQDDVEFQNLGLVVIDEQHRFGVRQRTLLKAKGEHVEMLTMTATPIPRTLAMTLHGDLDVSILDERPPGRTPIKTVLLTSSQHQQAYQLMRYEIQQGRQCYVVFPLVEESETLSAKAATTEAKMLQDSVFPELKVGLLHGKMKPDEKESIMADFAAHKIHILVSTTVVEVGVDVPNATVMVIENADRFGLAQLHQLRGRVGRGAHQSFCVLVSDSKGEETMERLGMMVATDDGFKIAEFDMETRGPGEFLGTRQSGLPGFILADLLQDQDILLKARQAAQDVIAMPNYLVEHPYLADMIIQKTDETMAVLRAG